MFWSKSHKLDDQIILAICDEEILGRDMDGMIISESFFKGQKVNDEQIIKLMQEATICNMFGKNIINIAKEKGFIHETNIILIGDVPHAQYVK